MRAWKVQPLQTASSGMPEGQGASRNEVSPEVIGAGEPGHAGALQRGKSQLTMMLAGNPKTRRFQEMFAGIPRVAKIQAEAPPVETLTTTSGIDFSMKLLLTGLQSLIVAYVWVVGIGFILALIDMAGGSCGQDTWKMPASEACEKLVINTLAVSLETRCFGDKPRDMTQKDFDEVCGDHMAMIISVVISILVAAWFVWGAVMQLPVKVNFHTDFFTVESWSGKKFECSFYADVTHARVSTFGLKITSKAKAKINAGGADDSDSKSKKGKTLQAEGNSIIVVLSGSGAQKKKFLSTFEKYLPVNIQGSNNAAAAAASTQSTASLLEGRMQEIVDMRVADSNSFKAVRMPITCDFLIEMTFIIILILLGWYICTRVFSFIGWAINNGQNKCKDAKRPDADMCAVWRIFVPVDVPLVNVTDYINLVLAILGILLIPVYFTMFKAMEYRLHQNGSIQEVLLAGLELQENKVFFPEDLESLELKITALERKVKMQANTFYTIKNGITSPFVIKACFRPESHDLMLADPDVARCCCQKQQACDHKEKLLSILNDFKPDMLTSGDSDCKKDQGTTDP